ncbi:MAG: DNA polymerase III subunit gamma/tau [Candidatus Omnitrophota bacterium]
MAYQVFALKWRPENFDDVVGQEHVTATLKNAISKGRIAHAYLFAGPRGVGKTSTARILAKALNCKEGPTVQPCQKCSSCLEISQARSLDVIEIDGASNRGIDEIRILRENVKFSPVNGKYKIYIIDEVHMLTTEAFNALLKTLEEPPEFVKFIFATTQAHKVLSTVLSRCQRFDFKRVPVVKVIEQLNKIVAKEKIRLDNDVLFAVARASDGSLRDAESILDQLISFTKDKISLSDVISVLGVVRHEVLFDITDKIIQKDGKGALELLNSIIDEGKDTAMFLMDLIEHFRNLMVLKVSQADFTLVDLPQDICERLERQSSAFTLDEIFSAFNVLVNTQEMARRLDSLRIPLEIGLIKLTQNKARAEGESYVKPVENKPAGIEKKPVVREAKVEKQPEPPARAREIVPEDPAPEAPAPEEPDSGAVQSSSLQEIKDKWQKIIDNLTKVKISAATYLNEGCPSKLDKNTLTISFPKNYSLHKEALEMKDNKAILEKTISQVMNATIRLNLILTKEEARREEIQATPFIKSALDAFNARPLNGN